MGAFRTAKEVDEAALLKASEALQTEFLSRQKGLYAGNC